MDRMNKDRGPMDGNNGGFDALLATYRAACPDPEPSAAFMPELWQRIEARRTSTATMFRRLSQVCVLATLALTLLMGAVLIPRFQRMPVYNGTYVDVLADEHSTDYAEVLTGGELR
jgi:hypothetical protein